MSDAVIIPPSSGLPAAVSEHLRGVAYQFAAPREDVIVVLLASGETGVMTAELELVSSTPAVAVNAPGGRA